MKVIASKQFGKDLKKCPADIQQKFVQVYDEMISCKTLQRISGVKKLTGFKTFYRVRLGNFRLGFEMTDEHILLLHLLHRKEIYRFFP